MKKKVFVCLYSFFPYSLGGREVWLYEITKKLPNEKYDVSFYTLTPPKKQHPKIEISDEFRNKITGISTEFTIISKSKYINKFFGMPGIKYYKLQDLYIFSFMVRDRILSLKDIEGAIFIAPNLGFECLPAIYVKKENPSCKLITLAMGEWLNDMSISYPHAEKILKKMELETANASDIIVYSTKKQYEMENKRLKIEDKKVRIVPLGGLDTSIFGLPDSEKRKDCRKKLGLNNDDFVLVNVAIIRKLKGQDILIKALNKTSIKKKIVMLFVGSGDNKSIKKLIASAGPTVNVKYLGWKNRNELVDVLWASDVFILPSLSEAIPIAAIEAIASGLPVVATDVGGVTEIVGDMGIIVKPNNEDDLARAIEDIYKDIDEYRKRVITNNEKHIKKYSLDVIAKDFEKVLDEM